MMICFSVMEKPMLVVSKPISMHANDCLRADKHTFIEDLAQILPKEEFTVKNSFS